MHLKSLFHYYFVMDLKQMPVIVFILGQKVSKTSIFLTRRKLKETLCCRHKRVKHRLAFPIHKYPM